MEQQRAINALEPFIALSKSANSPRSAADVIVQATSAPNTYVFAELLETSNVQALRQSPEHSSYLQLLQIFAWGTVAEYRSAQDSLPKLNQQQSQKLQLLTLPSLLSSSPSDPSADPLSYAYLQRALGLATSSELESLVQTALYASLIQGHLDPLHQRVAVTSVAPLRDLAPNSLSKHINVLGQWQLRCDSVLSEAEAEIAKIKTNAMKRSQANVKHAKIFEEEISKEDLSKDSKRSATGDLMDVDEKGTPSSGSRGVKRNLKTMFSR